MIKINCECRTCKNIFTIQYGPSGYEAVVQCEKCGQKYYHLLFERMSFGSEDVLEEYQIPITEEEFKKIQETNYSDLDLCFLRHRKARLIFNENISETTSNLALQRCGRQESNKIAYYGEAKNYMSGLKLASEDKEVFNDSERNALRGAVYLLVVQDERILEKQRIVEIKNIDVKFQLENYNVLFGFAEEGGVYVEVDFSAENCITKYYTVGDRPIKLICKPQNKYEVLKYDWNSGNFIPGEEYIADIFFSTSDVEQIAEDVFHKEVENLRKKKEL